MNRLEDCFARRDDFLGTKHVLRRIGSKVRAMDGLTHALEGVRVVTIATNIPGPVAASRLAAMGATVLKIEPMHGDPIESASPQWYEELCRGIEVVRRDLRDAAHRASLQERIASAQILITSMRASALSRADIGWAALHDRYPRLSQIAIVGESSPNADRAGHDLTYQARAGLVAPPAMPRTVIGDLAAAERAVWAALAALRASERTGVGCFAEIGIVEAAEAFAAPLRYGLTARSGYLGGALPAYGLYRARDGWIAVAALEPHFAERLAALTDAPSLSRDELAAAFATRSAAEWERLGAANDLPLAQVAGEEEA
jgi:crotonobetainyl-CoA:carnitine CoA-transferase CaiB-like acyl-CoA transferase